MMNPLGADLDGELHTEENILARASSDFGRVVRGDPEAVIVPTSAGDVVTVVRHARRTGQPITVRGAGHSQGGQSLARGGIVVDTRRLDTIEPVDEVNATVTVGAGLLWGALVRQMAELGWLPPVLTDNPAVTVGGTLAAGGAGAASVRHGLQVRHCLAIEVVLGTGDLVWASPDQNQELFHHVLGGLGQYGVVTRAALRLRRFRPHVHNVKVETGSIARFLDFARQLLERDQVDFLEGFAVPSMDTSGETPTLRHRYSLEFARQADDPETAALPEFARGLDLEPATDHPGGAADDEQHIEVTSWKTAEYMLRWESLLGGSRRPSDEELAHPWVEHFLPLDAAASYLEAISPRFPSTLLLIWPLHGHRLGFPGLVLPDADHLCLVGILASVAPEALDEQLRLLRDASELGISLGGKRYLSGWLDFDEAHWRQHYGPGTCRLLGQLKERYDPDRVFRSIPFGSIQL